MGLIVSLHFWPLAAVFRVRADYLTAGAGSLVSLFALVCFAGDRLMAIGFGMGLVLWASAVYLILTADAAARYALAKTRIYL